MKHRHAVAAVLALTMAGLSACGGGTATSPSNPPFTQTVTGTVGVFGTVFHPLTIPRAGNLTIDLTWNTTVDLDLYLTASGCTGYPPIDCQILAQSDRGGSATEQITRTVNTGEAFRLWVDNLSRVNTANYTIQIRIQ